MLSAETEKPAPDAPSAASPAAAPDGVPAATTESLVSYQSSQTFLARLPDPRIYRLRQVTVIGILIVFIVLIPLLNVFGVVEDYKLNFLGKYLCFAIVALGIDLIWGYTGLLSLCQALFFCLGGYAMAMHLSLPQGGGDVRPEYHNIPQFMFFNNVAELPGFWRPFAYMPVTVFLGLLIPGLIATVFGFFIFRSRVRGVYFSIITQAVAWGAWLLISRNEMLVGGTNGLTNFYKPLTQKKAWIIGLYLLTVIVLALAYLLCRAIVRSRLGRVLVAVRDKETRLYFAGYRPYAFKVFAFAVAAMLAALGGMLYSPQVTIISPQNMNVEASITMVLWVAIGGRGKLWGAIFGALLVNSTLSALTSDMSSVWLYVEGGMFIAVVMLFPDGFVGLWDELEREVKSGATWRQIFFTALPLVTLAIFVLAEALGMPRILQAEATIPPIPSRILVLVLAGAAFAYVWLSLRDAVPKWLLIALGLGGLFAAYTVAVLARHFGAIVLNRKYLVLVSILLVVVLYHLSRGAIAKRAARKAHAELTASLVTAAKTAEEGAA